MLLVFLPFALTGDFFLSVFLLGGGDCFSSNSLLEAVVATDCLDEEATEDVVELFPLFLAAYLIGDAVLSGFLLAGEDCLSVRSLFCCLVCPERGLFFYRLEHRHRVESRFVP